MYPGLHVRRADYLLYLIVMHSNLRGIEHQTNDDIIAIMQRIAATLLSSVLQSAHAPMCGACSGHCVGTAASLGQSQPRPAVSSVVQAVTHPRYLHIYISRYLARYTPRTYLDI